MRQGKKAHSERLERRCLLSASFTAASGLLAVNGSTMGDQVLFTKSGTNIKLVEAGATTTYSASSVKSIQVTLAAGADLVSIDSGITVPASITAGSGPDTLMGGGGHNTFFFGATAAGGGGAQYVIAPGATGAALDFSTIPAADPVTVDLRSDTQLATFTNKVVTTLIPGQAGLFTFVTGGPSNTKITANAAADSLVGGSGRTTLVAGSGADTLVGNGSSTDYVFTEQASPVTYTLSQAKAGQNQLDFTQLSPDDPLTVNLNYDAMAVYNNVHIRDAKAGQYVNFNTIYDGPGDDNITGNKIGTTILGGSGNDYIYGGPGADFIYLGDGFNVVSGEGGADTIFAGGGYDIIFANDYTGDPLWYPKTLTTTVKTVPPGIQVYGGEGEMSVVGGAGNDTIVGGIGGCTVHGMAGDDYIVGSSGKSVLFGDSGNDTIIGGGGDNIISGGLGTNIIYGGTVGGTQTFIDKNLPDNSATASDGAFIDIDALTANAITADQGLTSPTYPLVGTTGPGDIVLGGSANTTVIGGIGDETLSGGDGPSTLIAGPGFDLLTAGYNNSVLQGGAGDDTLAAGVGPDSMTGGMGNTTFLNLNGYADTIVGGAGFNVAQLDPTGLSTFSNIQIIYSPEYTYSVGLPDQGEVASFKSAAVKSAKISSFATPAATPAPPLATLSGSTLKVGSSSFASPQNYIISQSGGSIFVQAYVVTSGVVTYPTAQQTFSAGQVALVSCLGGAGADTFNLLGLAQQATVNAGNGDNTVLGGSGRDTLTAGSGSDVIYGGSATNIISGGAGNNILYGGPTSDSITGGSGSDWIYPYGPGAPRFNDTEADTITGGSGSEKLALSGNGDAMSIRLDKGTITDNVTGAITRVKNVRNVWAGIGNDLIVGSTAAGVLLVAGTGNCSIFAISASNVVYGNSGNDSLYMNGKNGFLDLAGNHASTPGNQHFYNAGQTILQPLVDATDHVVAAVKTPV